MTDVRLYRPRMSVFWWTKKRTYFVFIMRELSSFFVAWFVVYLLLLLRAISQGEAAYQDFLDPPGWLVAVNVLGLLFLVLHTVTWFHVTPQAMALRLGSRPVPPLLIVASQYVGLVVVSAFVVWLVTR